MAQSRRRLARSAAAWPAVLWVVLFMVCPLVIMFVFSFWRYAEFRVYPDFSLANYMAFVSGTTYVKVLGRTVAVAALTTAIAVALAYPVAYLLFKHKNIAGAAVLLVSVPFCLNTVVRNFSFYAVLGRAGLVSQVAGWLGLGPVSGLFTLNAVVTVAVYIFFPYALIALYSSMQRIPTSLLDAAHDLGAGRWQSFTKVVFPLSWSGLQAAVFFVFVPSLGMFVTPAMIGGGRTPLLGNLLVPMISETLNFARGSAFAFVLLGIVLVCVAAMSRALGLERLYSGGVGRSTGRREDGRSGAGVLLTLALVVGLIYLPLALVVIFSFDRSVAGSFPLQGFTWQWYQTLVRDVIVLTALKNSLGIACAVAALTTLIAAPAAYTVVRVPFFGRGVFQALMLIPIVIPELLLAAGVLMVLKSVGVPSSKFTIILGQATYALPYVFFVLLAQQYGFEKLLEEAAHDLGATPWQKIRYVTLPLMVPALLAGAVLAFTLSLNDFIFAYLLGGSTPTLPVFMWSMLTTDISPEVNALSSLLIVGMLGVFLVPILIRTAGRRADRRAAVPAG